MNNILRNFAHSRQIGTGLTAEERREVLEDLFVFGKANQQAFLRRMAVLLVLSTIIAACGLLADSAAVVIGAMLVAPMMRPVMSAAAAITLGWSNRFYEALILVAAMAAAAVIISALLSSLAPHMVNIPEQVMARTVPTFFDLIIALAAGCGGAYTMTRKESSAIPGVAMAVALLPPLASCGILIIFKEYELSLKAFVLFLTNFAAMVLAGSLTFLFVGISPGKKTHKHAQFVRNFLMIFGALTVAISVPLYFYSTEVWYDATYKANQSETLQNWLKDNKLIIDKVKIDQDKQVLHLSLLGPNPPLNVETLHTEIRKRRIELDKKDTPFQVHVAWTQQAYFSWPPSDTERFISRKLNRDFNQDFNKRTWHWVGTQYSDGDWLQPVEDIAHTITGIADQQFEIITACNKGVGYYSNQQETLDIAVVLKTPTNCEHKKIDERFINDINNVINIDGDNERISLRLANSNGVMYFESQPSKNQ